MHLDFRCSLFLISISVTLVNSLRTKCSTVNFLSLVFKSTDPQRNFKWEFYCIWSISTQVSWFCNIKMFFCWALSHSCTAPFHGWCLCHRKFINADSSVAIDVLNNLGTCSWQMGTFINIHLPSFESFCLHTLFWLTYLSSCWSTDICLLSATVFQDISPQKSDHKSLFLF
jgi:hypothetical protein